MSTETCSMIGKWKTRGGLDAVVEFITQADTSWPLVGYIEDGNGRMPATWMSGGLFHPDRENEFDLVTRIETNNTTN